MRWLISIESTTETRGSNGETLNSWAEFASARAEVIPLNGKESYLSNQDLAERMVNFRIRYIAGITPKMRILHDGRYFDIHSVTHLFERGRTTEILAREIL